MITLFEKFISPDKNKHTYYKIYVNKSIILFNSALVKLGLYSEFYDEWSEDTPHHIKMINNNNIVYLLVTHVHNFYIFNLTEKFEEIRNEMIYSVTYIDGGSIIINNKDIENFKTKKFAIDSSKKFNI